MIDEYFELQEKIHEYFGYKEDWVVIPLMDYRQYYWNLDGEGMDGHVLYRNQPITDEIFEQGDYYDATIYTQRFLSKWVYRTKEHTLICMDTHTDGNKYFGIFDNKKEFPGIILSN